MTIPGALIDKQKQPTYPSKDPLGIAFFYFLLDITIRITSQLIFFPVLHRTHDRTNSKALRLQGKIGQLNGPQIMCQNSDLTILFGEGDDVSSRTERNSDRNIALAVTENGDDSQDDSGFSSRGPSSSLGYYKPLFRCMDDLQKLKVTMEELDQSCFYWDNMDSDTARRKLRRMSIGTFLIRASSDPCFLYSLSVKTERGATSVRILYDRGLFQFDCDRSIKDQLPRFESVLALVDFYVLLSQEGGNQMWRWEEVSGDKHMKMTLLQPMRSSVPSLAHQARVKVNQCLENVFFPHLSIDQLNVPEKIKEFLRAYPYRS